MLLITFFPLDFVSWHLISPPSSPFFPTAVIWPALRRCDADRASLLPTWKCHLNQMSLLRGRAVTSSDPWIQVFLSMDMSSRVHLLLFHVSATGSSSLTLSEDFQFLFASETQYFCFPHIYLKLCSASVRDASVWSICICVSLLLTEMSASFLPSLCHCLITFSIYTPP